jgi:hypothetical protein
MDERGANEMAVLAYGSASGINTTVLRLPCNDVLAHLQAAAIERFGQGLGFNLTFIVRDPTSQAPFAISFWLHPSIELRFGYDDNIDDNGDEVVVQLDRQQIDDYLAVMDAPEGVVIAPQGETWRPFVSP